MSLPRHRPQRFAAALAVYLVLATGAGARFGAAQTQPAPPAPDYYDITGDFTSLKKINGETVLELLQNVRIVHGDVTVNADRAVSFTERRLTQLTGHVRVQQGTFVMTGEEGEYRRDEDLAVLKHRVHIIDEGWTVDCDEVRYSRRTGQAWLSGNVVGRDSTSTLRADRVLYERTIGRAEAFGSVELSSREERVVVRGRHGVYHRDRGEGVIDRDPTLVSGPDDEEPVTVVSDTMRVYPDSSRASAYYRVKIIKGNTVTQCDSAMLYDDQKRVELFGHPLARQDRTTMKGERMIAHYDEKEINRIDILGAAAIRDEGRDSLVVGRDSWVAGDTISLYLHDNDLDSLHVAGHASSEYYPSTPNKVESNFITGNRMFFRLGHDEIEFVDVSGKAAGTYRYLNLGAHQTADSLRAVGDSALAFVPFPARAERVEYSAEHIQYMARSKDLVLEKSARLTYHDNELTGDAITYHSELQILDATGSPTLTDAGQKLYGQRMDYDLESETGLVTSGSTQYEQGYYHGENMAKVGENELKVWNSWYTTCDLKEPHYHFAARTMKVYPDDKVFSGPIWLHVGRTPIFALPFMANSISRGRSSGVLRPDFEFGITSDRDRYIRNVGYYWATNDYTDFTFVGDFNEDKSWRLHINNQYKLRYLFDGAVQYSYFRDITDQSTEWTFDGIHRQTLGEKASLNAGLRFVSSDDAPQSVNTIDNVNRYIDRSIRSNVSLRKSWDTAGFSASASRTQNLSIVDPNAIQVQTTLPDVTLSIPSRNLYFGSDAGAPKGFWESILKNTRYSPALSGSRERTEKLYQESEAINGRAGLSLSSPQRIKFLTLAPGVNTSLVSSRFDLQRQAYDQIVTVGGVPDTVSVAALDSTSTITQFTWNVGVSANTNFYGTFYPRIGRLRGIRHTLTPSVSYSLTPAQNDRPRAQGVGLNLRNAFDLKVLDTSKAAREDTTQAEGEKVRKLSSVLFWNLSASYRPDLPLDQAWSNVNSAVNFVLMGMNVSINHVIDPYTGDLNSTSATSSLRIGGSHPFGKSSHVDTRELSQVAAADTSHAKRKDFASGGVDFTQTGDVAAGRPAGDLQLEKGRLPWSLSLGLSYSKSSTGQSSSTLRLGYEVKLTDNWHFDYSTIYDVERREQSGQYFSIGRDLHCWEMSFSRQLLGDEWQYYFRVTLKAHSDLYGESGSRGVGGGLIGQF
jgi:lipopolysaccharide assembly outer membrane protein LptD (OstA)